MFLRQILRDYLVMRNNRSTFGCKKLAYLTTISKVMIEISMIVNSLTVTKMQIKNSDKEEKLSCETKQQYQY